MQAFGFLLWLLVGFASLESSEIRQSSSGYFLAIAGAFGAVGALGAFTPASGNCLLRIKVFPFK